MSRRRLYGALPLAFFEVGRAVFFFRIITTVSTVIDVYTVFLRDLANNTA